MDFDAIASVSGVTSFYDAATCGTGSQRGR